MNAFLLSRKFLLDMLGVCFVFELALNPGVDGARPVNGCLQLSIASQPRPRADGGCALQMGMGQGA